MHKMTVVVMASMLAISSTTAFAIDALQITVGQNHMFDGVSLTEEQRQQMRDLMHQARYDRPGANVSEMETMYKLVTADKFDDAAVRALAEKMAQEQVKRQVEMARIRNQMFNLLTPEQKNVLDQKHQQRMQQMQQQVSGLQQASAQKLSMTE